MIYDHQTGTRFVSGKVTYVLKNLDTLIGQNQYHQIFLATRLDTLYYGAVRSDSDRVYIIPKDSIVELKVYDYSLQTGDSLFGFYDTDGGYPYRWVSKDFEYPGQRAVVMSTHTYMGRRIVVVPHISAWIEGIGAGPGLFGGDRFNDISWRSFALKCFTHNDTIYLGDSAYSEGLILNPPIPGSCAKDLSVNEWTVEPFSAYPNPSQGSVQFNNRETGLLQIYQSNGLLVKSLELSVQDHLDLSELAPGLYYFNFAGQSLKWLKL